MDDRNRSGKVAVEGVISEPPEAVITGDTVPDENQEEDIQESALQRMIGRLKTKPQYQKLSDTELREKAREKLEKLE